MTNPKSRTQNGTAEPKMIIDLVFKPIEPGLKLRLEETQLLLAYMGEILKEIEEEQRVIEEEKAHALTE